MLNFVSSDDFDYQLETSEAYLPEEVIQESSKGRNQSLIDVDQQQDTKIRVHKVIASVDTEYYYDDHKQLVPISLQIVVELADTKAEYFILNEDFAKYVILDEISKDITFIISPSLKEYADDAISFAINDFLSRDFIPTIDYDPKYNEFLVQVLFYYSPNDLTIGFGRDLMLPMYRGKIKGLNLNRKFISGHFRKSYVNQNGVETKFHYIFFDIAILDSNMSLLDAANSLGLSTSDKTLLDKYKSNMDLGFKKHPTDFINYGMSDSRLLIQILDAKIKSNNLLLSSYDIKYQFTRYNFPKSLGSLVNCIFKLYLEHIVYKNNTKTKFVLSKLWLLNNLSKNYTQNQKIYEELVKCRTHDELENLIESVHTSLPSYFGYDSTYLKEYSHNSIKNLQRMHITTSCFVASFRTGGRTVNETPTKALIHEVVDPDLEAAYTQAMMRAYFPIGRPRLYCCGTNDSYKYTLGDFLLKYESKVVPELFKVVVTGSLTFNQDLLYSRCLDNNAAKASLKNFDVNSLEQWKAGFNAPIQILTNELQNVTITFDMLEVLRAVCTNKEFAEIKATQVIAASYYLKSDRVDTIEELVDVVFKDTGTHSFDETTQMTCDTRTFSYYLVPVKDFIGPLLNIRKECKAKLKEHRLNGTLDSEEARFIKGTDTSAKNTSNTWYGVVTSLFFSINNICVADFITAFIRIEVWKMQKALNSVLSITDGGCFSLNSVNYILPNAKKPSMNALSSTERLGTHPSVERKGLGVDEGVKWGDLFAERGFYSDYSQLETEILKHVSKFWDVYGLKFKCRVEVKRTALKCAYFSKAHYALLYREWNNGCATLKRLYKVRGVSQKDFLNPELLKSPLITLLDCILDEIDEFNTHLVYHKSHFVSLKEFKAAYKRNKFTQLLPGSKIIEQKHFRINNSHAVKETYKIFKLTENRSRRTLTIRDKKVPDMKYEMIFIKEGIAKGIKALNSNANLILSAAKKYKKGFLQIIENEMIADTISYVEK
jgi:hypothetical protein